jgi:ankyrin repeat protein
VKINDMISNINIDQLIEIGRTGYQIIFDNLPDSFALAKSARGDTLLHVASSRGFISEVNYLLQNGAQINAHGEFLFTPLHCAAIGNHEEIYQFLLLNGADESLVDCYGLTADTYFD